MDGRRLIPRWLRRGLLAGALGAVLSGFTLVAFQLSRPAPRIALPQGIDGSLILVPALLALGVLAVTMPIFSAGTRSDATLGALAGFLIAADLLMLASVITPQDVRVHVLVHTLPLGVIAALLAIPAAVTGIVVSSFASEHGFGHSAGIRATLAAGIVALLMALIGPYAG